MKKFLIKIIRPVRAGVVKLIKSKARYFLATRSLKPISSKYGYDRGNPIDRYYIEKFLEDNRRLVKGRCLEIVDNSYTRKYGGKKVKMSDTLDNDPHNKSATIHGDLRNLTMILANTYDCLIITQTFGMIDDLESSIRESHRILKPGGVLLMTSSALAPDWNPKFNMWRFTVSGAKYIFGKYFKKKNLTVKSYGNVLSGQFFWVGMAAEELTKKELDFNDPHFPLIITLKAIKERGKHVR